MKKRIGRRLVSLLLTVVTILTMLPAMTLPALAAISGKVDGSAVEDIGLSFTGDAGDNTEDPWSAKDKTISGSVQGSGNIFKKRWTSTLTITNNKTTKATLSFGITIETKGGKIQVDKKDYTLVNNPFSKELGPGESIDVYIDSGKGAGQYAKITMTNVTLVSDTTAAVTFLPAENGSYTVDKRAIKESWSNTQSSLKAYQVDATPAAGYQFRDWYDVSHNKSISRDPNAKLNIEKDCTIKARFTTSGLALFETGGLVYDDLTNAITAARGKSSALITQVGDGTISGIYTIPSGVTLLIPFDEVGTLYKSTPTATRETPETKSFRTLTMAEGSSITLENGAAISVGGQYYAGAGGESGKMVGPYGHIIMESGSAITVQGGASLYAWGFISGSGSVTVEPDGSVYEWYQILDFRGGRATSSIVLKGTLLYHLFPLSQYTVQNIEVPLTLFKGASETVYAAVYAKNVIYPTPVQFIGNDGMFKLTSGSLTKTYDVSTDRLIYTINGDAEVNSLSLSLAGTELNSSNYVLPFTNNMTVVLKSGNRLTMNQTAALLPSVSVTIEKDAELVVPENQSMYIYDVNEWGPYCVNNKQFVPVPYTPTPKGSRTLTNAKINVNGTLTAAGSIYTTKSGADIYSSEGSGKFAQQSKPGTNSTTYQATQNDSSIDYVSIPITAAKLKNADGKYIGTKDAKAGDTFTYCTCPTCGGGKWTNGLQVAAIINGNGEQVKTYATLQEAVKAYSPDNTTAPTNYIKLLHNTTEKPISVNNKSLYLDLNGRTVTGDISVTGANKLSGMDSSTGTGYDTAPSGKIVGKVTGTVAPVFEKPLTGDAEYNYLRYVAIKNEEGTEYTFHRFNISVTGYRFELATGNMPECALFFIGKFQGDDAAKKYLTSLGITLTGGDGKQIGTPLICKMPDALTSDAEDGKTVILDEKDGSYLFEAYLKRIFEKTNSSAYTEKFVATAQAAFKNGGTQNSDTKQKEWSFKDAWTDPAMVITPEQQAILDKFLKELGITKQAE